MGWEYSDCVEYFYKEDFEDDLPGVDLEMDGYPCYNDLNEEQLEVVRRAYDYDQELRRSYDDLWTTPR